MRYTACLLLIALNPIEATLDDRVDVIETNHFYDEQGRLVFDQLIFWSWSSDRERYQIREWRLVKSPSMLPTKSASGEYVCLWQDGEWVRRVSAPSVRETWTQHDPELYEREHQPKERRTPLSAPAHPRLDAAQTTR